LTRLDDFAGEGGAGLDDDATTDAAATAITGFLDGDAGDNTSDVFTEGEVPENNAARSLTMFAERMGEEGLSAESLKAELASASYALARSAMVLAPAKDGEEAGASKTAFAI